MIAARAAPTNAYLLSRQFGTSRRLVNPLKRRRKLAEFARWTAWSHDQLTATVGAHIAELYGCAIRAKRTFKGANACLGRLVGQVAIAAFAVRAQREHG